MKIRNLNELRLAKIQTRYDMKLQEHALSTGLTELTGSFVTSLKSTLKAYTKELITNLIIKLIVNGKRREQ